MFFCQYVSRRHLMDRAKKINQNLQKKRKVIQKMMMLTRVVEVHQMLAILIKYFFRFL